jgi:predicted MFS family arabinose efflux permease
VLTGIGIGAVTSALIAITYEYMPPERRRIALGVVGTGFPIGASLGGYLAAWLIPAYGWRSVFWLGAALSLAFAPVILWRLPESMSFLIEKRPKNALARLNRSRELMHLPRFDALPAPGVKSAASGPLDVLRSSSGAAVLKWSVIYFLFMASFYFILSWAAKLMSQMGFSSKQGIAVSTLITVGGVAGSLTAGLITRLLGVRPGAVTIIVAVAILIAAFPIVAIPGILVYILAFVLGWMMWAGAINLYALTAGEFSASVRTSGLGLTLGAGRVGSVLGPYAAGVLLTMGLSIGNTCLILGVPAIAAAAILLLDRSKSRSSDLTFLSVDAVTATNVSDPAFAKLPTRAP